MRGAHGPGAGHGRSPARGGPPYRRPVMEARSAPPAVRLVVALVALEAGAALAGAVAGVVVLVRGAQLPGATAGLVVLALCLAAALGWAGRALLRGGRRWARSPVLSWQFMLGVLALAGWSTTPQPWPTIVVLVAGVVVGGMVAPSTVVWTSATSGTSAPVPED